MWCVVARITAFARDIRLRGAQGLVRNRVRYIRLMYIQNDYTLMMAAAGKMLTTSTDVRSHRFYCTWIAIKTYHKIYYELVHNVPENNTFRALCDKNLLKNRLSNPWTRLIK